MIQDGHSTAALVASAFVAILRSKPTAQDFGHFILRPQVVTPDVPAFRRASPIADISVVRSDPADPTRRAPANLFVQVGFNSEHGWELLAHAAQARLDLWGCRFWLKTDVGAPLRQGPISPLYNGAIARLSLGRGISTRVLSAHINRWLRGSKQEAQTTGVSDYSCNSPPLRRDCSGPRCGGDRAWSRCKSPPRASRARPRLPGSAAKRGCRTLAARSLAALQRRRSH